VIELERCKNQIKISSSFDFSYYEFSLSIINFKWR